MTECSPPWGLSQRRCAKTLSLCCVVCVLCWEVFDFEKICTLSLFIPGTKLFVKFCYFCIFGNKIGYCLESSENVKNICELGQRGKVVLLGRAQSAPGPPPPLAPPEPQLVFGPGPAPAGRPPAAPRPRRPVCPGVRPPPPPLGHGRAPPPETPGPSRRVVGGRPAAEEASARVMGGVPSGIPLRCPGVAGVSRWC